MPFFSHILCALWVLTFFYPTDGFSSNVTVPREIQDLIECEKRKGPLRMLQCSTPLGGKRPEVIQIAFYPKGSNTGPIQIAGVAPEEKVFNATTERLEVVGTNLYTIFFDPAGVKPQIKAQVSSATSSIPADRQALYWQQECAKLGLPPSEPPSYLKDSGDDDRLDLSD